MVTSGPSTDATRRRSTTWWTDVVFLGLALGAIVILVAQVLGTPTESSPIQLSLNEDLVVEHFGGSLALVSTKPETFVIRTDGQRFDQGERLPSGATLALVESESLTVNTDDQELRITLP